MSLNRSDRNEDHAAENPDNATPKEGYSPDRDRNLDQDKEHVAENPDNATPDTGR